MAHPRATALPVTLLSAFAAAALIAMQGSSPLAAPGAPQVSQDLRERAARDGRVRVIVELELPAGAHVPEGQLPDRASIASQRAAIEDAAARVLSRLSAADHRVIHRYRTVPYVALDVSGAALAALENNPNVVRVIDDALVLPVLAESVPLVEGDQAWDSGYDGTGTVIAVLDSGVDSSHPFLAGKVIEEACYSSSVPGTSQTFCPNGQDHQIGPGSAQPCSLSDCYHGTHVAGIAAGSGQATVGFSGVAKGAHLMAVQVFSKITKASSCGGFAPCVGGFTADVIAGLERVYEVAAQHNIVSVNMSLGGGAYATACDSEPYKPIIDNLRSIGVASVVATGNSGETSRISAPACVSTAVSVASTTKTDTISWFSNMASFVSLLAPGESITSSLPGGSFGEASGTSMATPHVAGAWALLRQASPGASVTHLVDALRQTGVPIADDRSGGSATVPRVRILRALATLVPVTSPAPAIEALVPARVRAGSGDLSLTILGSGFNTFSVARWNGAARPTTVLSTTTIAASIPASDLTSVGSAQVSVFTPAPGGGTSAELALAIDPPPSLAVSATAVAPGSQVTVTLANGTGGSGDWLALSATGSPETSYLQWVNVGAGVFDRTWTVTMPATAGTYEFRLMVNYVRLATSEAVTVDPSLNPIPAVSSLSPSKAIVGGSTLTLTVNGGSFVSSSVVRWNGADRPTTFVSAWQLRASIGAGDLAATGTAQVTVFTPAPGGGSSPGTTFTISPPPSLAVGATSVVGGSSDTVTLTNGLGGLGDWIALASTSAPNTSYVWYSYVGQGVTNQTWTVTMPLTAGTYEFRLFLNGGYTRAATSPAITVSAGPNPVPTISSLSPAATFAGAGSFTLSVTGTGFVSSSIVRWNGADRPTTFVSASQVRASIPASDVTVAGTAQVTVVSPSPGGGTSAQVPFTIGVPPTLSVSATTVSGGASVTMTLTNGFGGSGDWLALAATSAANTSCIQFTYVGAGVTSRTWTVTMPATGGTYEFRLFLNNGYTRAATSPTVTVQPGPSPVPSLSALSPSAAAAGGAAFTLSLTGSGFVASSVVRWNGADRQTTYVSSGSLKAAIPAGDLAASGTAQVTVFNPAPGGGVSAALPFAIGVTPVLTVNATTVAPGASVTVTLTNGFGGSGDWLALAASASNMSYIQFTYVGAGVTSRTWTVTMPSTAGTYEFRYFPNNTYTRAATSPPVTVQ